MEEKEESVNAPNDIFNDMDNHSKDDINSQGSGSYPIHTEAETYAFKENSADSLSQAPPADEH